MNNYFYPGSWLCILDLDNTQQCYARCFQLVQWLEQISKENYDIQHEVDEIPEFLIMRKGNFQTFDKKVLLELESCIEDNSGKKYHRIISKEQLLAGLMQEKKKYEKTFQENRFSYYFRIHIGGDDNDITELQYFVLLLQMMPSIQDRMAVRLMEGDAVEWNESNFFRVSHFLQFIQIKYHCFFSCYNENLSSLRALQTDSSGTQTSFIPMLEVNGYLCQILNKTWLLSDSFNPEYSVSYDKLYTTIFPKDCEKGDLTDSLFRIGLRILFKSLPGKKYARSNQKRALLDFFIQLVESIQGITPLDMLLFGALAGNRIQNELDPKIARECMGEVQMLSLAVGQILENIVNHSEGNQGVFTFRIQKNREYIESHYPGYAINEKKGCLELLIADGNRIDGIVDHFLNSNKADNRLKSNAGKICLGQLLGDYQNGDISEIWDMARREHPEMCHGLISFSNSVRKLNGAYRVRSTPEIESKNRRDIYYFSNSDKKYESSELLLNSYVPGTQFSVILDRTEKNTISVWPDDDWAFDFDRLVYATTYKDLAKALAFDKNIIEMDIKRAQIITETSLSGQAEKDRAALFWKNWFNSYYDLSISGNRVFECDLEPLCPKLQDRVEMGEVFCKGFLGSHFFINPSEDIYNCIVFKNASARFSRIFAADLHAVETEKNAIWERTGVYFILNQYKGGNLPYCTAVMQDMLEHYDQKSFVENLPRVFPWPLFINTGESNTWFEQELSKQANVSITNVGDQGFKVLDTHMRLGNKVHIDEFYEMALFFENPNYAYYTAFLFLRTFLSEYPQMLDQKPHILFYGYASYSRAIIWAICQLLKEYKCSEEQLLPEIEFVIYQNDLKIDTEEPQIQMCYSRESWQRNPQEIWDSEETTLVSIVPISSSLTTFDKMCKELNQETGKNFVSELNYTAFWVRNKFKPEEIYKCTDEERGFWESVDPDTKTITSKFLGVETRYLAYATSTWRDPLGCTKCFPKDVIFEYPLVETDPTSTVPTQQFYMQKEIKGFSVGTDAPKKQQNEQNDERIANLKGNMLYGHISKGDTHYQYFVKTQVYFQQERDKISQWLKELRKKAIADEKRRHTIQKTINVLIIPQKTDNVEFSQYVYEYYFQGCAECVIVNTEKEFRSNFKAVYNSLFIHLREVATTKDCIKFHYVDTSLQSGNSYERAVSLVSACVEDWTFDNAEKYDLRIEHVFLLISRLSESSKRKYVQDPDTQFHAYAQLSISAMRTFGDSCVPCKLQQEAERYYKKAATKSISSYWEMKKYDRACQPFDQVEMNENADAEVHEEGYRRMICSHRAAYYIQPIQGASVPDYFMALRKYFDEICYANHNGKLSSSIYQYITAENRKDWLAAGMKVIARPFFSYDYKIRCAVMDMYLLLAEHWIGGNSIEKLCERVGRDKNHQKCYLSEEDNIAWIRNFIACIEKVIGTEEGEMLSFIRNNILKSLADIKSNYILRKDTIIGIGQRIANIDVNIRDREYKINEFYQHYIRSILRVTQSSSDETKSLWLEYLLQFGEEYRKEDWTEAKEKQECNGITKLVNDRRVPRDVKQAFRNFLEVLLVENNRPFYQLVVELDKKVKGDEYSTVYENTMLKEEEFLNEYRTRKAAKFLKFGRGNNISYTQLRALHQLLMLLNQTNHEINRYYDLGETLQRIVEAEADPQGSVVLYGESRQMDNERLSPCTEYLNLPNYFELYPHYINEHDGKEKTKEQMKFEENWETVKGNKEAMRLLNKNGFYLICQDGEEERVNIIIKLENNYDALNEARNGTHKIEMQRIEPVFIYIPCFMSRQQALGLTRKILMFRKKLIEWLEMDFNNNAIAVLARQQYLAKVLSTDKMGDHNDDDFIECQEQLLMAATRDEFNKEMRKGAWEYSVDEEGVEIQCYEVPEDAESPLNGSLDAAREWFFLRSYVNSRISRLFRTMARTGNELERKEIIDIENYYARRSQSVTMRPVNCLGVVFFTPIKVGLIRKNYLWRMMETVTFTIQDVQDYRIGGELKSDATVDERMENVKALLSNFYCISIYDKEKGIQYAYLAEYLVMILLDCFISGLKAGEIWNHAKWGGEAFKILQGKKANEKCEIIIKRDRGGQCGEVRYDYLVIRNKVCKEFHSKKKGFGMSQAAIKWYINSIWSECIKGQSDYPRVRASEDREAGEYIIKLPILKGD